MTQEDFYSINWKRGNKVRLDNGKEYLVKGMTSNCKYLILYSEEYDKMFIADYAIVDSRTSDYAEPEEVYLQHKAEKRAAAEAKRQAEIEEHRRKKEELKQKHLKEQEAAHAKKMAAKEKHIQEAEQKRKQAGQKKEAEQAVKAKVRSKEAEKPATEAPKPEEPVLALHRCSDEQVQSSEVPQKRVRQRIRVIRSVGEKVSYYKKK